MSRSAIFRPALAVMVAVVGLSACGGGSDDETSSDAAPAASSASASSAEKQSESDGGGDLDVCALLTLEQLQTAFGSPFDTGSPTHHEQTGGDQCVWSNTDAPPVKVFSVAVNSSDGMSEAFGRDISATSMFEETRGYATDPEAIDLGDDAYLSGTELQVLKGDRVYAFSTTTGTSDAARDGMLDLAASIIEG